MLERPASILPRFVVEKIADAVDAAVRPHHQLALVNELGLYRVPGSRAVPDEGQPVARL
jgi:hypothetical protein